MFCKNCGYELADGDKFCSSCGTKNDAAVVNAAPAPAVESAPAPAEDKPLFEPFDFKAFGFDFSDLGLGTGIVKEEPAAEETKPTPPTEEFNWNTGAFPDRNAKPKTEEVNFNWSLSPEEVEKAPEPEIFTAPEPEWTAPEPAEDTKALEEELFGDIGSKADETRKQSEEIDKFFTFHKKNEEFQKILDREYEKVKSGNIITEEINTAEAVSEEKFTARQPEDPMEALFAAEGVIKGYEPKPIESDVLDRIEAAEAEKRIREEAERIAAEERAKLAAEAALAEEPAEEIQEEPATESAEPVVEETTAAEESVVESEPVAEEEAPEEVPVMETPAEEPVAEEPVAEAPAAEEIEATETAAAEPAVEEIRSVEELVAEPAEEEVPEKTKQVDKAAILASMAIASEMVERDRAAAAEEAAAAAAAEEFKLPDFLGHAEEVAEEPAEEAAEEVPVEETEEISVADLMAEPVEEAPAVEEISFEGILQETEAPAEETVEEEPAEEAAADELPELELDIFEQLEAVEVPAEEIVLDESQTISELFAEEPAEEEETVTAHTVVLTEDSVAEILKTVEEDTTKDDTMVFTAHALGALLAEAEQTDPDAKEVVVSLEDLTELEQQAAEGTLPPVGIAEVEEEEEEEIQGGKGRTFLKICLVILVILLVLEVAGVAIKIAAPTSGAANFIDNQLEKVFMLIGDEEADPSVLSADNDFEA